MSDFHVGTVPLRCADVQRLWVHAAAAGKAEVRIQHGDQWLHDNSQSLCVVPVWHAIAALTMLLPSHVWICGRAYAMLHAS